MNVKRHLPGVLTDRTGRRAAEFLTGALGLYWALQWLWPAPAGVIVQGVIVGGLTALVAFGLALIYRANRVINFAQADLGAVPAVLAVSLMVYQDVSYWLVMPGAILLAVGLGVVVEAVFIRRFRTAPRLILMVVTIGLAQIFAGLASAIPFFFDKQLPPQRFNSPFDFSFTIAPLVFHANDLLAVVAVVGLSFGLVAFLRLTPIGIAIRASAESADRASLLGISIGKTQRSVWVVATVLATVAMLLRAGVLGLPIGSAFGPSLLLRALTAAVIARMENFGIMFVAAAALGVIETSILWNEGATTLLDPVLLVIVIATLLFQRRRRESRVEDQATSTWQEVATIRPIPRELAHLPEVRWAGRGLLLLLLGVLAVLPLGLGIAHTNLAAALFIFAIIAVSLVILTGWAGEISLGQIAFVGIGAAVSGSLNAHFHWDLTITVLAAGLVGAASAVLVGLPALRIRGLFLAVSTLAFALATSSYLLNREYMHFLPDSLEEPVDRLPLFGRWDVSGEGSFYFVCLAILAVVLWAAYGLQNSRTFRVLIAARDNERAAQAFGINITRARLMAFALAGFFASLAGGLLAIHQRAVGEQIFAPIESIRVLTMVVVGGLGSIPGALLGTLFVQATTWFNTLVPSAYRFLFTFAGSGVGLILVLFLVRGGLGSLLYQARDRLLRKVAERRGLLVPSLVADAGHADAAAAPRRGLGFWWNRPDATDWVRRHPQTAARRARRSPPKQLHRAWSAHAFDSALLSALLAYVTAVGNFALYAVLVPLLARRVISSVHLRRDRDLFLGRAERIVELGQAYTRAQDAYTQACADRGVRTGGAFSALVARLRRRPESAATSPVMDPGLPDSTSPLLLVEDLDVSYGQVQVLFGVDLEIDRGQIIALLGTNGAGKSTVLRAVSGLATPGRGRVIFDGIDITGMPPDQIAALGIAQVPGGRGVFPGLTVEENLTVASWLLRHDRDEVTRRTDQAWELFPILAEKRAQPAAMLSGGQQQMLTLAMALTGRPKLLMIDELSLGLAPVVVEQLLGVVRQIRDAGTTVILVEQSVNVALTAADTAYFLEKGEVKFHGPTAELLDRPDVLRAVYLQGTTASVTAAPNGRPGVARTRYRKRQRELAEAPVVLETHGLGKSFATNVVISDLSIALRQGEILGIVGPNGAGKTTLFDLISGFLRPDAGRIELRGRDVTGLGPDRRSKLGLLRSFQDARLFGSLTVHQAVCVALDRKLDVRDPVAAMLHLPEPVAAEKRLSEQADQLIEAMNIAAFRDKFVGELSTGSRRIVDLACILGSEPDVILFDEPSSGIAQREAEALGPLLHDIRERTGASLIVIEHDMPLVTSVADRLIALNLGRFVIEGDANTVLGHPEVVASYLGSNENVIARSGTGKATAPRPAREGPPGRKEPAQA